MAILSTFKSTTLDEIIRCISKWFILTLKQEKKNAKSSSGVARLFKMRGRQGGLRGEQGGLTGTQNGGSP